MSEQTSIPKHKFTRAASLTKAGVKMGANYLQYRGKKALTGKDDRETLHQKNAESSYRAFSELKGGPLKLAQMLSMDQNLLPAPYIEQFSQAQYQAPPLSLPLVNRTFRREFGKLPKELFDTFSTKAVSGASIGQVHKASLDGKAYAVKVQYPGVAESLRSDLRLVKPIAARMFNMDTKALAPYFKEVEARLLEETDYLLESSRATALIEKSKHLGNVEFPAYHSELSSAKIITMDWMEGVPLDQYASSSPLQKQRDTIGQALWDFYQHQVHELRVFHADPHPGNFLVRDDTLVVLDFGCVKSLTPEFYQQFFSLLEVDTKNKNALKEKLISLALIERSDAPRVAEMLLALYRESVELLARPFHCENFDFGDPDYMRTIAEFGERIRHDKELQKLNSARGPADAIYVNRAYFGLYHLLAQLRARVNTGIYRLSQG